MDNIYQICEIAIQTEARSVCVCRASVECRDPGIYDNNTTAILMLLIVDALRVFYHCVRDVERVHISNQCSVMIASTVRITICKLNDHKI